MCPNLSSLSRDELYEAAQKLQRQCKSANHRAIKAARSKTYWKRKTTVLVQRLKAKTQELRMASSYHCVGSVRNTKAKTHRLSLNGGYALAVLRNVGHASLLTTISVAAAKTSRQSLALYEVMLAANIAVDSKQWYEHWAAEVDKLILSAASPHRNASSFATCASLSWEIHTTRGDATNTPAAQSLKAHTCEIASCFRLPSSDLLGEETSTEQDAARIIQADLAYMPPNCTANLLHRIYGKHMASVGCPAPSSPQDSPSSEHMHVRIWLFFTDSGADEVACARMFCDDTTGDNHRSACFYSTSCGAACSVADDAA